MSKLSVPVGSEDHRQGDLDAAFTLVEYGDYECPSCGQAYPIVKRLQKHFGKRLLFVFRNFPLSQMHPHAESAAETAESAAGSTAPPHFSSVAFDMMALTISTVSLSQLNRHPHRSSRPHLPAMSMKVWATRDVRFSIERSLARV